MFRVRVHAWACPIRESGQQTSASNRQQTTDRGKSKSSEIFIMTLSLSVACLLVCLGQYFFANEKNTFVGLFFKSKTGRDSGSVFFFFPLSFLSTPSSLVSQLHFHCRSWSNTYLGLFLHLFRLEFSRLISSLLLVVFILHFNSFVLFSCYCIPLWLLVISTPSLVARYRYTVCLNKNHVD
jgi:hypothetical protein